MKFLRNEYPTVPTARMFYMKAVWYEIFYIQRESYESTICEVII